MHSHAPMGTPIMLFSSDDVFCDIVGRLEGQARVARRIQEALSMRKESRWLVGNEITIIHVVIVAIHPPSLIAYATVGPLKLAEQYIHGHPRHSGHPRQFAQGNSRLLKTEIFFGSE